MKILIIGTGHMARGIGSRLPAGNHDLALYNPDRADAEKLADEPGGGATAVAATLREPIDAGGLVRARQLEALGLLGITLKSRLDTGFGTAWKLVLPYA
jgi:8-hydroxy-5-deazaflavin:NADPH oxidoreductase